MVKINLFYVMNQYTDNYGKIEPQYWVTLSNNQTFINYLQSTNHYIIYILWQKNEPYLIDNYGNYYCNQAIVTSINCNKRFSDLIIDIIKNVSIKSFQELNLLIELNKYFHNNCLQYHKDTVSATLIQSLNDQINDLKKENEMLLDTIKEYHHKN